MGTIMCTGYPVTHFPGCVTAARGPGLGIDAEEKLVVQQNPDFVGHCSFWPTALTTNTSDGDYLVTTYPLNSPAGIAKSVL